jgi:DNA polymerase I
MQFPYTYAQTDDEIVRSLELFLKAPYLAVDTETTGLDPYTAKLLLLQLATDNYIVVINCIADNAISRGDRDHSVWKILNAIFTGRSTKIGHNIGFDFKIIKASLGIEMVGLYDTMIAEKVLVAGKDIPSNRYQPLKTLVPKYISSLTDRDMNKGIRADFYSGYILSEFNKDQLEYSARDAGVLLPIYWQQIMQLQKDDLARVAQLEFDIIPAVALMEYFGVNINIPYWQKMLGETEQELVQLRKEIQSFLKPLEKQKSLFADFCGISIDSPAQLGPALRSLGLIVESTGADILEKISGSHPIIKPLLRYRELRKVFTSYGAKLLARQNPVTGRFHASFKQNPTSTGRFSSAEPNLQNIPAAGKFRQGFVAPEGYYCLGADFGGQELRVLAYLSNEINMIRAFQAGKDIHNETTCKVYKIDAEKLERILGELDRKQREQKFKDITKEEEDWKAKRGICKSANFLTSYGGSYKRLADVANISEVEAKRAIDGFFVAYPALKQYIEVEGHKAIRLGYSKTLMGRRRNYTLPPTSDPDYQMISGAVRRQAVNHTIQGTSADMSKLAIKLIHREFCNRFGNDNAYLWCAVHDEVQAMVKKEIVEEAQKILVDKMTEAFHTLIPKEIVPCKVDSKWAHCWSH